MRLKKLGTVVMMAVAVLTVNAAKPVSVFITAGQSNADGRETLEFLPDYLKDGYRHLHYANVTSQCDGTFSDFRFDKRFAFCDITNYYIEKVMECL